MDGSLLPVVAELAGALMEGAGIGTIVFGALWALGRAASRRGIDAGQRYKALRLEFGKAILLGLEFLVAADIIRTVSAAPTMSGVLVLGMIVLVRTFLSVALTVELEGRWPWQKDEAG